MTNTTPATKEEIEVALKAAESGRLSPVRESIQLVCEVFPEYRLSDGRPFPLVHRDAIPERFHAAIKVLSLCSTCPAPNGRRGFFYTHDVYRWLRAIGVLAEFVEP